MKQIMSIMLVGLIFLVGCQQLPEVECEECIECEECVCPEITNELKPMVDLDFYWGEYERDQGMWFELYISNYGDNEAKNVEVTCEIYNQVDMLLKTYTFEVGNVASRDIKYSGKDIAHIKNPDAVAVCSITSCYDCIILRDRINDNFEVINENTNQELF